jgi:prevent-host-death family protein
MYYKYSFSCETLYEGLVLSMSPVRPQDPAPWVDGDDALVYTMRDLNQRTASIMSKVEKTGKPAFITRHGRFVAMITPLAPEQVESRVLAEMAREIANPAEAGPLPP